MFASKIDPRAGVTRLAFAFLAGFISVLVFHQAMLAVLHLLGVTPAVPWTTSPVPPLGVPQVISAAFWGGVWGLLLAPVLQHTRSTAAYWITAIVFGAFALSTRIPQMDQGNTAEALVNPSENRDSYFHPPFGDTFSSLIAASH